MTIESKKLLFVENKHDAWTLLLDVFCKKSGFELFIAGTGFEGLKILERVPEISIVISDYNLTDMDGVVFLTDVFTLWPRTLRVLRCDVGDIDSLGPAIKSGTINKVINRSCNTLHQLYPYLAADISHGK
ncbi:hypothetical protein [Geotalea sp. SG265]|uniref:hypothetical protein n=1 Tax=Geotalea sp. SG265 TaxID=2922867 RepID=UPI001FAF2FE1|nr:hypothetical protein [Geotalea sp. SG265]